MEAMPVDWSNVNTQAVEEPRMGTFSDATAAAADTSNELALLRSLNELVAYCRLACINALENSPLSMPCSRH